MGSCLSEQDSDCMLSCLGRQSEAREPFLTVKPANEAEARHEDICYVLKKALENLNEKLKKNEEVTEGMVYQLLFSEGGVDDDILVPVNMKADANIDLGHVKHMVEKLGPKRAAETYTKAAEYFEAKPENERPKPKTVAECKAAQEAGAAKKLLQAVNMGCCCSCRANDSMFTCLGWQLEAREPLLTLEPAKEAENHLKDVGYVLKKALQTLNDKLQKNEEVVEEMLYQLPSAETDDADDILVPVIMGLVPVKMVADSSIDIVHVKQMIEQLGAKKAAETYTKAAEYFQAKPEDERSKPLKIAEWKAMQAVWAAKKAEQQSWEETHKFLEDLKKNGSQDACLMMKNSPESVKGDRECVLAAVAKNGLALQHADRELKANKEVALAAVTNRGRALQYVVDDPKVDKDVVLAAVAQHHSDAIRYVKKKDPMWEDRDFVMRMVQAHGDTLKFATSDLKGDKDILFTAFQKMGFTVKNDMSVRQMVLAAVAKSGKALEYVTNDLKHDKDVMFTAFLQMGFTVENHVSLRDMVLTAMSKNGHALQYVGPELKDDRQVVLAAVKNKGNAWIYASDGMRKDKDILFEAFKKDGVTVDQNMTVKELLLATYKVNGFAFQHAADSFRSDRGFVLEVVKVFGEALEFADPLLKADKDVVLAAIASRGLAFEFVDKKAAMWKKNDFVLRMVQWNGKTLEFADDDLKKDKEVVLAAVRQSGKALKFAKGGLNQNEECLKAAGLWDVDYMEKAPFEVIQSVKFSLAENSTTYASEFALAMKKDPILKQYKTYNPNAWEKDSCDPVFTNIEHKCRGTHETCQFPKFRNLNAEGKPYEKSCWRLAFRFHLEQCKANNGFMIQVQEKNGLGAGQKIETIMAEEVGLKVFRTCTKSDDFRQDRIEKVRKKIEEWRSSGCANLDLEIVNVGKDGH